MNVRFVIAPDEQGRIDKAIARRYPGTSRRALTRMFRAGRVRVDGRKASKGDMVTEGAQVELAFEPGGPTAAVAHDAPDVTIIFEDAAVVTINKPAGMPSHPLTAGETGTAANVIAARFPECTTAADDPREAGLVHRLDTFTSGVLVAARSSNAWQAVRQQFHDRTIAKTYLALVHGNVTEPGSCNEHLSGSGRIVRIVSQGQSATTRWQVTEQLGDYSLLRCTTEHGRRHQVRVHLAHAGHPIVGDELYGGRELAGLEGHFLHAETITLASPDGGGAVTITAPMPGARAALLASLRLESGQLGVHEQEQ